MKLELHDCASLKDKRRVLRSLKEKVRRKFCVSISEVEFMNKRNEAGLGLAVVSNDARHAREIMDKSLHFIEKNWPGILYDYSISVEHISHE